MDEIIIKLKEVELEMDNMDVRYTLDDIKESISKIINKH